MSALLALVTLAAAPRFVALSLDGGAYTTQATTRVFVVVEDRLTLRVNGAEAKCSQPDQTAAKQFGRTIGLMLDKTTGLAHCTVELAVGRNVLKASVGKETAEADLTRYDTTGPLQEGVRLEGFGPGVIHTAENEALCQQCHEMHDAELRQPVGLAALPDGGPDGAADGGAAVGGVTATDGGLFASMNDSSCTTCHSLGRRQRQHGPVGQGMCMACHDAKSEPRYAVRWPIQETCFRCHVDIKGAMFTKAFRHGPAAAGRCTTCHDPHGSNDSFWLKKQPFDLCTNCHPEKRRERHVVVGFVYGDSHPVRGRPHPLKPNQEFACPACHNPHAAQSRFLWQFDATQRETLCRTCHQK